MSELEALVAVHGAIDRAIVRDPELRQSVAPLLRAYGDQGTAGWFEELEHWTADVAPGAQLPDLDAALGELAERVPKPRMAARRLLAIAALVRANPELAENTGAALGAALGVNGIVADRSAGELLDVLTGASFASIAQWADFVDKSVSQGLLAETLSAQVGAPPCSASVRPARTRMGRIVDAATISTFMRTDAVDFECALRFLEPVNWPGCSDFWCAMNEVATKPNGNPVFHEVVSLDCASNGPVWCAEAYLEFGYSETQTPKAATMSFQLDPERTAANDWIVVDEGWLKVTEEGSGVRVETVKTIAFRGYFHSASRIAAMMCPIGYGDAAGELLFNCAVGCEPGAGTRYPGSRADDDGEG